MICMMVSDVDLGWIAGFFDGEGTVVLSKGKRTAPHLNIAIVNTDLALLQKAQSILDALEIDNSLKPAASKPGYKQMYRLYVGNSPGVQKFFARVPTLSEAKRNKFEALRGILSTRPHSHSRLRRERLCRQHPQLL